MMKLQRGEQEEKKRRKSKKKHSID